MAPWRGFYLHQGLSIKDVHREGEGGYGQMRTGGGVKDLADVRKMALFLELFQHALLPMGDGY